MPSKMSKTTSWFLKTLRELFNERVMKLTATFLGMSLTVSSI